MGNTYVALFGILCITFTVAALYVIAPHPDSALDTLTINQTSSPTAYGDLKECKTKIVLYPINYIGNGQVSAGGLIVNLKYAQVTIDDTKDATLGMVEPTENKMVVEAYHCLTTDGYRTMTMTSAGSYYYVLTQRAVVASQCSNMQRVKTDPVFDADKYCDMPLDITPRVTIPRNASRGAG